MTDSTGEYRGQERTGSTVEYMEYGQTVQEHWENTEDRTEQGVQWSTWSMDRQYRNTGRIQRTGQNREYSGVHGVWTDSTGTLGEYRGRDRTGSTVEYMEYGQTVQEHWENTEDGTEQGVQWSTWSMDRQYRNTGGTQREEST